MKLLIVGGGTGGHIFPGIAVAEAFQQEAECPRVLFVGTSKGMANQLVPEAGFSLSLIHFKTRGLKGGSFGSRLKTLLHLPRAFVASLRILDGYSPNVVLGTGGYATGPLCLMARLLGIPVAIQEQNAIPGLTNRLLGKVAKKIFVTFPGSAGYFPGNKTIVSGNPVRAAILKVPPLKRLPQKERLSIFVLGGSQGARRLNEAMIAALPGLATIKTELTFVHQTGAEDVERVQRAYDQGGFDATVAAFFADIASIYTRVHLVIGRSGGGIFEVAACGRGMVLVPFPYAADNHQSANARLFVKAGAAMIVEDHQCTGPRLSTIIQDFNQDRPRVVTMGKAAYRLGQRDAATIIAKTCVELGYGKQA